MVETLLVVYKERCRFFHFEWRKPSIFAPLFFERDTMAYDLAYGQPGTNFVEQLIWVAHDLIMP